MRKYGFDYLVEKTQLLMEMPASVSRPETNPNVIAFKTPERGGGKGVVKKITNALFDGWRPTSGTAKIANEYVAELLYEHNEGIKFPYGSLTSYAKKLIDSDEPFDLGTTGFRTGEPIKTFKQDFLDFVGPGNVDSGSFVRWILSYLMNKADDYLLSEELLDKATDPDYISQWREEYPTRKAAISGTSKGFQKKVKGVYNMSVDDFARMRGEVWPIIVKINRKTMRMAPRSSPGSYALETIIFALEGLIEEDSEFSSVLGPLLNTFKNNLKSGNIISKEEIESILEDTLDPISKELSLEVFDEFDFLYEEGKMDSEVDDGASSVDENTRNRITKNKLENYDDEFLNDVVKRGIISEEEREIVDKWRELIMYATDDEIKSGLSRKEERETGKAADKFLYKKQGEKWEAEKASKAASKKSGIIPDDGLGDLSLPELEEKLEELLDSEDPDFSFINKVEKRIKKKKKEGITESNDGVMGYFSEQVQKDQRSNPVGEYKDRGFRKAQNYHQWMLLNGM